MEDIKLSILIPSTFGRFKSFLPKIYDQVNAQLEQLTEDHRKQVEVLILTDNKQLMLGDKRNKMVDMCQGEYYVFVDDDDRIATDYIATLLEATYTQKDVITFQAEVSLNGEAPKICHYSAQWRRDYNTNKDYRRIPNHICCVRTELGRKVSFPNVLYGEDSGYSKVLLPLIKSEHHIQRVLYYYDYNQETTETQMHLSVKTPVIRKDIEPIVDIVILSNATTPKLKSLTEQTIDTAIKGANGLPVNIIVIEQNTSVTYKSANKTVHNTEPFHYNKFANQGAKLGKAKFIMIANNDLKFKNNWLHALISVDYEIVSPYEPTDIRQRGIEETESGYVNGRHLSGWCFMISRKLWKRIGGFDEGFNYWFADDSLVGQLERIGVEPMVVRNSVVVHLGSQTLKRLPDQERNDLQWSKVELYNQKYGKNKFVDNPNYLKWKQSQQ